MAENGIWQIVYPRIGEYADRERPELVHNEINAWQHILNVIYQEALRRGLVKTFLEVLSLPLQACDNNLKVLGIELGSQSYCRRNTEYFRKL